MLTDSETTSRDKILSHSAGCPNKIGFVRTSSCNYDDISEIEGYALSCHMWDCPVCAKVLKNQLLDRIALGFNGVTDAFFFTVTSSYRDMDIKASWVNMRHFLSYYYPVKHFVAIMELTPPSHLYTDWKGVTRRSVGGLRHFHGLISFVDKIPSKEEFGALWLKSTKGEANQVHFEKLYDLRRPAGYISKYVTKALHSGYRDRERRVMFSRNFPKLIPTLEVKPGVYMPYDPRHKVEQYDDFAKMLEAVNLPFKNKGKRYLGAEVVQEKVVQVVQAEVVQAEVVQAEVVQADVVHEYPDLAYNQFLCSQCFGRVDSLPEDRRKAICGSCWTGGKYRVSED
jgi:hypothetical protein